MNLQMRPNPHRNRKNDQIAGRMPARDGAASSRWPKARRALAPGSSTTRSYRERSRVTKDNPSCQTIPGSPCRRSDRAIAVRPIGIETPAAARNPQSPSEREARDTLETGGKIATALFESVKRARPDDSRPRPQGSPARTAGAGQSPSRSQGSVCAPPNTKNPSSARRHRAVLAALFGCFANPDGLTTEVQLDPGPCPGSQLVSPEKGLGREH